MAQLSAYSGHKRKHAMQYQTFNTPDGLVIQLFGHLEGRGHDWTLCAQNDLESVLPKVLEVLRSAIVFMEILATIGSGKWRYYTKAITSLKHRTPSPSLCHTFASL